MTSAAEGDQVPQYTDLSDRPKDTVKKSPANFYLMKDDRLVVTYWDGLPPSPESMAAYAKISPDLPEKILRLALNEVQFQQKLEQTKVKASRRALISGVITVFALPVFSAAMASALASQGADYGALLVVAVPAISSLGAIFAAFLTKKRSKDAEFEKRAKSVADAARAKGKARMRAKISMNAEHSARVHEGPTEGTSGRAFK